MPTPDRPSQALSSTSAAAAGTIDTSPFFKERRGSLSMKRQHEPDADYSATPEEGRPPTAALGERGEDGSDDEGADRGADTVKRQRMSVDLTTDNDTAGVELQQHKPKPARVLVNAASSLPSSASVSPVSSPSMSRRGSMTEDQKRASFTHSLHKALSASSAPSSPTSASSSSSPLSTAPPAPSLAAQLEQALYSRHHGLTMEYTSHVRDIVYNLTHNAALRRRIVDGDVDIVHISEMSWKDFADKHTKRERGGGQA